ncbi:MAG: 4-amino-4-deoxy-L-arabinose transferase [Holophagaceae bacterium]|nr:4-amino-4-deoxy-L-arabinose transferase [Holophagaceae bacterium]
MAPTIKAIPLIVIGVLLNAGAQILLKKGLQAAGGLDLHIAGLFKVLLQPWVLGGLAFYAVSVVVWLGALSLVDVNYAYPFLALGFLANAILARMFLAETIPPLRWAALAVIVIGVGMQAWSGKGH